MGVQLRYLNTGKLFDIFHCVPHVLAKAATTKDGIGGLKIAMDFTGYFGGNARLPLKRPGREVEEGLKELLLRLKK
jgi:hypothetical protein